MNLSLSNMTLELNVFNICKQPHDKEDEDSENEGTELNGPTIKETHSE